MDLSLFRAVAGEYQDLRHINTVTMMNVISRLIEDQVIDHKLPVDFYAGFQRFSNFPDQSRRYARLGAVCRRVYLFGVPDVSPPSISGVEFVKLSPTSSLAREWFLLVDTPDFWTALLTMELSGRDPLSGGRRFDGIWSYDEQVINRASLLMSQATGSFYRPTNQRNYAQQNRHIAEISNRLISKLEATEFSNRRRWVQLSSLVMFAEALMQAQTTPTLLVNNCPVQLLQETTHILNTIFGAPEVAIALYDGQGYKQVFSSKGPESSGAHTLRPGQGPSGRAVVNGSVVRISDTTQASDHDLLVPGMPALLAAPIVGRQRIHGVITVGSSTPDRWNEEDGQTILAMAKMMAVVIEQRSDIADRTDAQPERSRLLEQAIVGLRKPISHMLYLQQQLRLVDDLSPAQEVMLQQIDSLGLRLAQIIGAPLPAPAELQEQEISM